MNRTSLGERHPFVEQLRLSSMTREQKIVEILNQLIDLIEGGTLGEIEGNGLIAYLDSATKELDQGKIGAAADILEAFVSKVEAEVRSGNLTPAIGVALVKAALNVLMD